MQKRWEADGSGPQNPRAAVTGRWWRAGRADPVKGLNGASESGIEIVIACESEWTYKLRRKRHFL